MNHDRQLRSPRLPKLPAKHLLLHIARRMIVVIIEAHFAPRDHSRMLRQLVELLEMFLSRKFRFVRMNSHRRVNPVVLLGKRNRRIQPLRPRPAADRKQRLHSRRPRPFKHRVAIFIKLRKFQMRMRVDNFQFLLPFHATASRPARPALLHHKNHFLRLIIKRLPPKGTILFHRFQPR